MTIEDNNLAVDESRRLAQHEGLKDRVAGEVGAEVAAKADQVTPVDAARADVIAGSFKEKAYREVVETEAELETSKGAARVSQIIDYVFYLIYGIIGLEIILELLGARDSAGFKKFVDTIAAPFLMPFNGLMPTLSAGPFKLVLPYVFALIAYLVLHLAVNGLLRLFAHRKVAV